MACLGGGNDGGVGDQGEVDPGEGDQVGFELIQVNVKSSVICGKMFIFTTSKI